MLRENMLNLMTRCDSMSRKKIKKLKQHGPKLHDIHIVLATEKYHAFAEVAMHVDGHAVVAKEETKDLYQSMGLISLT